MSNKEELAAETIEPKRENGGKPLPRTQSTRTDVADARAQPSRRTTHARASIRDRADEKLEFVARIWEQAFRSLCSAENNSKPLERTFVFRDTSHLGRVSLRYDERNLLFAKTFDLTIENTIATAAPAPAGNRAFPVHETGTLSLGIGSNRLAGTGTFSPLDGTSAPQLLADRLESLGARSLTVSLERNAEASATPLLTVRLVQLVGSSTWNLIPPVLQLIEPTEQDCRATAEVLRMATAIARH